MSGARAQVRLEYKTISLEFNNIFYRRPGLVRTSP